MHLPFAQMLSGCNENQFELLFMEIINVRQHCPARPIEKKTVFRYRGRAGRGVGQPFALPRVRLRLQLRTVS